MTAIEIILAIDMIAWFVIVYIIFKYRLGD